LIFARLHDPAKAVVPQILVGGLAWCKTQAAA